MIHSLVPIFHDKKSQLNKEHQNFAYKYCENTYPDGGDINQRKYNFRFQKLIIINIYFNLMTIRIIQN